MFACLCMQDFNMHSFHFDDQYNTFHSYGYAVAPGGQAVVGDEEALADKKGAASPQGICELPITLKRPLSSFFHTGLPEFKHSWSFGRC